MENINYEDKNVKKSDTLDQLKELLNELSCKEYRLWIVLDDGHTVILNGVMIKRKVGF